MNPLSSNQTLAGRTVLIAPTDPGAVELSIELERHGARVIQCGKIEVVEPDDLAALDDAITNLFGYDWLIFKNANAAQSFLRRLLSLGLNLSELDSLRVCAIGEATATSLSDAHVHVDLVSRSAKADEVLAALETFIGCRDQLNGLNFLAPQSSNGREILASAIEGAGARVDVVPAYRTVLRGDFDTSRLNALLAGGGIDCVVFTTPGSVSDLAQVFDASDLGQLLAGVTVACSAQSTLQTLTDFGLQVDITEPESAWSILAAAIARRLSPVTSKVPNDG